MKKKLLLCLVPLAVVVALGVMPGMVSSSIPTVHYITPSVKTYENVISCTGTIQSRSVQEIYLLSGLIPGEVHVSVGDYVQEGEVLLTVDTELTQQLLSNRLGLLWESAEQEASSASSSTVDWAALASQYGLSAAVSGADLSDIQGLLGDAGIQSNSVETTGSWLEAEGQSQVTAPVSGVVTAVNVKPSVPTVAGQTVFTIADPGSFKVLASVGEADIAKVKVGDTASVYGVGFSGKTYYGTVYKIYPTARKTFSGTSAETVVDVEILLSNGDSALKHGFTAKVEIAGEENYPMITVPYESIRQDDNNDEYVWVYRDGKIERSTIITGQELISEVEVLAGLDWNSIVIYNPDDSIREGAMISLKGRVELD